MTLAPIPPLFDRVPAGLMGPLHGPLAPLYWSILSRFYQLEFEREPFFLVKSAAVEVVEELLRQSPSWLERGAELATTEEPQPAGAADMARRLVARLERAGWFHYEYRSTHGLVLSFYPHAARILDTLVRIARDEQPVFQGYAHSIASLLKPDAFAARPGISLHQAKRHTLELVRELKILDRNISVFIQRILDEVSTAAGVLEEGLDRYRHAVMANYHRLKTVENLYKWRADILDRLESIERNALLLDAAARWYAEQLGVDAAQARRAVDEDLRVMRMQFESIPEITQQIDVRNARFSGAALRKLMYLLRQDRRTEGQLQLLVEALARDRAPELDFDVYRCQLLADGFLYTPPARRQRATAPQRLARRPRADAESVRRALDRLIRRPYARARIQAYVDQLLGPRARAPLSDAALEGDEDFVRLIFIAAYGLDGGSSYAFRPEPGIPQDRKGRYAFPRGQLERTRRRR